MQKSANEKGVIIIVVLLFILTSFTLIGGLMKWTHNEARLTKKHADSLKAFYLADAGLKQGLWQLKQSPYDINTASINASLGAGSYAVSFTQVDNTITITSLGNVNGETRRLQATINLKNSLAEYLVMVAFPSGNWTSGPGSEYGIFNAIYPEGVPLNPADRMQMYATGNYTAQANVDIYGDLYVEGNVNLSGTAKIHGDLYVGGNPDTEVDDGYSSADGDSVGNISADVHTYTEKIEYPTLDFPYFSANNNLSFTGGGSRYLEFAAFGASTQVDEYNNSTYGALIGSSLLPATALVYVDGNAYVRGIIKGKVTLVSTGKIAFLEDITYANVDTHLSDSDNAAAWLAYDDLEFWADELKVSGIFYSQAGKLNARGGHHDYLYLYGNRIMSAQSNLSPYDNVFYIYDSNINNNPPPHLPLDAKITQWKDLGN